MSTLTPFASLEGHTDRVWHAAWHPSLDLLATCGGDRCVKLWLPARGSPSPAAIHASPDPPAAPTPWRCVATLDEGSRTIRCCEWSPCGTYLAACSFDGTIAIWKKGVEDSKMAFDQIATLEGHDNEVKSVAWNRSGTLLASCSRDKNVWLWESAAGLGAAPSAAFVDAPDVDDVFECAAVLSGHTQDVKHVVFHPTEDVLLSCSYDDTIKVWREADVGGGGGSDWYCAATLTGHTSTVWCVCFEPGAANRFVSVSDDTTLKVWELARPATVTTSTSTTSGIVAALSPTAIVSRLWPTPAPPATTPSTPAPTWACAATLTGHHKRTVYSVDWGSGHGCIATGAADDAIRVFKAATAAPEAGPAFELVVNVQKAHSGDVNCVKWCPRAPTVLVSTGDDGLVKLWKLTLGAD